MTLNIQKYVRKPFAVEAVEVTPDNIREVAKWCRGRVVKAKPNGYGYRGEAQPETYIRVFVRKPLSDRQTRAYYGDWVLLALYEEGPPSFKVYTPQAFEYSFEKEAERMMDVVERMDTRAEQQEKLEFEEDVVVAPSFSNNQS